MKFGHYTNVELGIRRNITCAMFDSKGVSVEPVRDFSGRADDLRRDAVRLFCLWQERGLCDRVRGNFRSVKDVVKKIFEIATTSKDSGVQYDPSLYGGRCNVQTFIDFFFTGGIEGEINLLINELKRKGYSNAEANKAAVQTFMEYRKACKPYAEQLYERYKKKQESQTKNEVGSLH